MYVLFCPVWRVEGNSSFLVLQLVPEDVDTLEASSISDGQVSVSFRPLEPIPDLTEDQAHCSCNCEGIDIQIFLIFYFPVPFGPVGHPISH